MGLNLYLGVLCHLVIIIYGAHRNKFRSCSSAGFCTRQKELNSVTYYLDPNSVKIENNEFQSVLLFASNPNDDSKKLYFSISRVINNVIRLFSTELHSSIKKRYQINYDVITENSRKYLKFNNIIRNDNNNQCILQFGNNNKYQITIIYNPFQIIINKNGKNEIIINEFNKFYFETYRKRKEYNCNDDDNDDNNDNNDNNDCETLSNKEKSLWEEQFSSHTYYYDNGPASIGLDFTFIDTQNVYGIPEHASSFSLKNTINNDDDDDDNDDNAYDEPYRLWNLDVFEYELDVPDALYGAIPYIISHNIRNTNSILWLNAAETYIDIHNSGNNKNNKNNKNIRWMSESGVMESFILLHDNEDEDEDEDGYEHGFLYQYYLITGFPQLPPISSLGHHQCRWNYNDIEDVQSISDKFDILNIPNDFIWLDIEHTDGKKYFTWDKYNFESPDKMLEYVSLSGRNMITIVDPHIKEDNNYYIHNDINDRNLWIYNRDNNIYSGWCWPGTSRYPDFLNPLMREYWSDQFNYNNYKYSSSSLFIWNDMNEPSVFDGPEVTMPVSNIHYNNILHNEIHNLYGYYVHMSTYNGLLNRDIEQRRPFVLSRSFFVGSQKYGAIWTGDNTANWEHLRMSIPMILSMSISGLPFIGADIGGFFNNPDGELMARWYEFGAYYPFFRNHAHQDTTRRELWEFEDKYSIRMKHSILARYRILPYIYTLFYLSSSSLLSSSPIIQPLWYKFSNDITTYNREDAFMFGYAFYIQPIVESSINEIDIKLPQNQNNNSIFYEISINNKINIYLGGLTHHLTGYESRIPVLRYGGSITTEKHRIRRSSKTMKYDPITIICALDINNNALGYNYIDDEETMNHLNKKEYILSKLIYIGNQNKLINEIIYSNTNNNDDNIPQIEVERIVIMGQDINNKQFNQIYIKQLKNQRKTKQFGVAQNTLAIRKPQILLNIPFEIILE